MKTLVVIPAYNESANIATLIKEVRQVLPQTHIVVIDDGSADNTGLIARRAGATVLTPPYNVGIGGAVQTGLKLAVMEGYDYIVRIDGDGQHPPREISKLLPSVVSGETDIAFGSRFCEDGENAPVDNIARRIGIFMFSRLTSILTGQRVTDPTSGFMAMNANAAAFLAKNLAQDYPEVDARVLLARAGYRVCEHQTEMRPRQGGVSSINSWRSIYYIFKVALSAIIARSRLINPE